MNKLLARLFLSKEMIEIAESMNKNNCKIISHKVPALTGSKRVFEVIRVKS